MNKETANSSSNEETTFHCWYSREAAKNQRDTNKGTCVYRIYGIEKTVTHVTTSRNKPDCNWDDILYLGPGTFCRFEPAMDTVFQNKENLSYLTENTNIAKTSNFKVKYGK